MRIVSYVLQTKKDEIDNYELDAEVQEFEKAQVSRECDRAPPFTLIPTLTPTLTLKP